jgi:spermidine/putrescine transport system ATP-binding protein
VTHDQEEAMTMSDRIAVMNHGQYEQLGDPESLYERPTTHFVAGFLGVSNLLPATSEGVSNGYAVCRLEDDTRVRVPAALMDGRRTISVGIRPEKIRLSAPDGDLPAATNHLRGVIKDASYIGVSTQYIVEARGGTQLTVYEQNVERATKSELWTEGEEVALSWLPEHTFVIEEAAAAAEHDPTRSGT